VNKDGHTARTPDFDLMVAMNSETYAADVRRGRLRGLSALRLVVAARQSAAPFRHHLLGVPFARMCTEAFAQARERILMKNIVYVGTLVALLNNRYAGGRGILDEKFKGKAGPRRVESPRHPARLQSSRWITSSAPCPFASRRWTRRRTRSSRRQHGHGLSVASMPGQPSPPGTPLPRPPR